MLPAQLKDEKYYLNKLSMFMRSSYGVEEMFEMLITILVLVDDAIDALLTQFDITNDNIFLQIWNEDHDASDLLDKFAHLYGVKRNFTMTYHDDSDDDPDSIVTTNFELNNFELWMLIKAQILQNQFNGTYKQITEFYNRMHLPIKILTSSTSASAFVYMQSNSSGPTYIDVAGQQFEITENIKEMFKAGLFTIKSLGIGYYHYLDEFGFLLYKQDADVDTDNIHGWDKGVWDR